MNMPKNIFLLVIVCFVFSEVTADTRQRHIIGTKKEWGFFASFFNTISGVVWCEENNQIPIVYWDSECPYYNNYWYHGKKNAWEYYFAPVSEYAYQEGEQINRIGYVPKDQTIGAIFSKACYFGDCYAERLAAKKIIDKHIRIRSYIQKEVNHFFDSLMAGKKTIGIHLRGTDKHTEFDSAPPLALLQKANSYKCDQYLVATDEYALLDLAKKILKKPVIHYNSHRSINGEAIHIGKTNKARAGKEVLIEVMLLAKCNLFIHTCSNVSMAALCFNPMMKNVLFPPLPK